MPRNRNFSLMTGSSACGSGLEVVKQTQPNPRLAQRAGHYIMTNTRIGRDILRGAGRRARRGPQWEYERVSEVPCVFCEGQGGAGSCSGEIKGDDMKVFVAGASGAIGQPLIAELIRKGHTVTGMTQSETGGNRLRTYGAEAAIAMKLQWQRPCVHRAPSL